MLDIHLEKCEPPFYARTGHAQTILGHLLPSEVLKYKGKPIQFQLPDGDLITGYLQEGSSTTVVSICHGLAGSTDSTYMHRTARVAAEMGHTVVMFNHRGCGDGAGFARHPYHSGRGEDISEMIAFNRKCFPRHRQIVIGFSMSGNALLCLLTGLRGSNLPDAAIVVNAPIDLASCSDLLGRGWNRIYDTKFYFQCRRDVLANLNRDAYESLIPRFGNLARLDSVYTAPAGGFKDRFHYYSSCSTHQHLGKIKIPTVILTSEDDPFVPIAAYRAADVSPHVYLHIEPNGGHMGYLNRGPTPRGDLRWQDYAIQQFLKAF